MPVCLRHWQTLPQSSCSGTFNLASTCDAGYIVFLHYSTHHVLVVSTSMHQVMLTPLTYSSPLPARTPLIVRTLPSVSLSPSCVMPSYPSFLPLDVLLGPSPELLLLSPVRPECVLHPFCLFQRVVGPRMPPSPGPQCCLSTPLTPSSPTTRLPFAGGIPHCGHV